jgi:hypothetical protein
VSAPDFRTAYAPCPNSADLEHTWVVIQTMDGRIIKRMCERCGKEPWDVLVRVEGRRP